MDLYFPEAKQGLLPVLVHIHGGGWTIGDKSMTRQHGLFYAGNGILFISVNYRLSPQVTHPAHVEDCASALAWVFAHTKELKADEKRIFLSGHSAGAQLASLLATDPGYLLNKGIDPSRIAGVIPVDTASFNLLSDTNEPLVKKLVKEAFGTDPEILRKASPYFNVQKGRSYPDFLIFNTSERKEANKNGEDFAKRLRMEGAKVSFVSVEAHSHKQMNEGMYQQNDPVGKGILDFIRGGPGGRK